tara:strand:- start:71 stop:328 length:258 start_codon:yes stop_codon:yes gene_type:complete
VSDLNQKRLDQMIDNALAYKQEVPERLVPWLKQIKNWLSKPIATSIAAASLVILTISFIPTQRTIYAAEAEEIYELVMLDIIDDF